MSLLAAVNAFIAAESVPNDGVGSTSLNPILPPTGEMIIGSIASGTSIRDSASAARIQKELDDSSAAAAAAEAEAERIRSAKGDIDAERSRLYAEADAQAEALLADGRERLTAELAELEARVARLAEALGIGDDDL